MLPAGREGRLDWLLDIFRARKIDHGRLSILALMEAFVGAMKAVLTSEALVPELTRWAAWTVITTQRLNMRSRPLRSADASDATRAADQAETPRRQWIGRAEIATAADWMARWPQLFG